MATEDAVRPDWESQAEVDAVLAETGVTIDQIRRWRREGLLPDVIQDQQAYRGSVVRYPKGTCAQIRAANVLFKQKNRVDYVGLRLWIYGFPVDEKFWRPRLRFAGRVADKVARLLPGFVDRFDRSSSARTFFETAAVKISEGSNIVLSRIKRRVEVDRLPAFVQVMEEVGRGDFAGFGHVVAGEEEISGRATTVDALDLQPSERDSILGHKLNLLRWLPTGLENVSTAVSMGHFAAIADAPAEAIAKARDDARNGVLIGFYLYEANRWIYGDGAFGLRLLAWIARKAPDPMIDGMTLLMFRLRQVPGAIRPSDEIAEMAKEARDRWIRSKNLERLWRNDPRFCQVLDPKRIKSAFADKDASQRWQRELNAVIVQGAAKPLIGSNDESQKLGRGHPAEPAFPICRAHPSGHAVGRRRYCLGDPLWHVAKPRGKGVCATYQTS
jgi:hypothetical protein